MTTPQREAGFYWVTCGGKSEIAKWDGGCWSSHLWMEDGDWQSIGPRVPTPEELASIEAALCPTHRERISSVDSCVVCDWANNVHSIALASIEAQTARECAEIADAEGALLPNPSVWRAAKAISDAIRRRFKLDQGGR